MRREDTRVSRCDTEREQFTRTSIIGIDCAGRRHGTQDLDLRVGFYARGGDVRKEEHTHTRCFITSRSANNDDDHGPRRPATKRAAMLRSPSSHPGAPACSSQPHTGEAASRRPSPPAGSRTALRCAPTRDTGTWFWHTKRGQWVSE